MTYSEYKTYMKLCEFLSKEPSGQYRKMHDFLPELWGGMEFTVSHPNTQIFLRKENGWFFDQDFQSDILWCQNGRVWKFFQKVMGMNITDRENFIRSVVEEHLQCRTGTPFEELS